MPDPDIILDAHLDIAYATLVYGRSWTRSVGQQRQIEKGQPVEEAEGIRTAALPDALLGRVGIGFGTIFTSPAAPCSAYSDETIRYSTPREAYEKGLKQLDVYNRLADENDNIVLIRDKKSLQKVLDTWAADVPFEKHCFGIVISMEGGDPILEPKQFEEWYERGVRAVGPAWVQTRYAGGTGAPGPLTALGRELLDVMTSFNAILDLSHLAEKACYEAIDTYEGTIIASHSNARKFCNTDRHLTDAQIRRLAERGGVVGIPMFNPFLKEGWRRASGSRKSEVRLDDVIAAIDYICQLTGSSQHVGIGSDLDGGFGLLSIPEELDSIADLRLIGPALAARGYSAEDIHAINCGNFLRILRQTLPE